MSTDSTPTILVAVADDGAWHFEDEPPAAITASAIPVKPPREWFEKPDLAGPTALTVTPAGRVYGHAAAWGVRHVGLPGHRTAPRSSTAYRYYRTGQVECDDGSMVDTGRLSLGGGHADIHGNITAATEHYDSTSSAVADLACGEDEHGIWFAGALRPESTPEQVRALRASSVSGDWRPVGSSLEMCGLLAVNLPGFPTPRAALAASGAPLALIAAGAIPNRHAITIVTNPTDPEPSEEDVMPENTEQITDTAADTLGADGAELEKVFADGDMVSLSASAADLVAMVTGTDADMVTVQVEVPRDRLAAASDQQIAMVSSAVKQRLRDREIEARFATLTASVAQATERAEQAEAKARGVEALSDLNVIPDAEGN